MCVRNLFRFIKDGPHARMFAGFKRRIDTVDPLFDETTESVKDHLIIISNFGDTQPEEAEPDVVNRCTMIN